MKRKYNRHTKVKTVIATSVCVSTVEVDRNLSDTDEAARLPRKSTRGDLWTHGSLNNQCTLTLQQIPHALHSYWFTVVTLVKLTLFLTTESLESKMNSPGGSKWVHVWCLFAPFTPQGSIEKSTPTVSIRKIFEPKRLSRFRRQLDRRCPS